MIAVGRDADTPLSRIADEFYQINTQDVDAVSKLVEEETNTRRLAEAEAEWEEAMMALEE